MNRCARKDYRNSRLGYELVTSKLVNNELVSRPTVTVMKEREFPRDHYKVTCNAFTIFYSPKQTAIPFPFVKPFTFSSAIPINIFVSLLPLSMLKFLIISQTSFLTSCNEPCDIENQRTRERRAQRPRAKDYRVTQ